MPAQSVWMIRGSLVYFSAAILAGGLMLVQKAVLIDGSIWSLLQIHIELALFGWLIQFVMGTAYWMLPRFLKGPKRGSEKAAWFMVLLWNAGIWFYILSHLKILPAGGFLFGRILELSAVVCFIYLHWNRIVPYKRGH